MPIIVDSTTSPGTTLELTRLWLNDLSNPADLVSLAIADFAPTRTVGGRVTVLASGRLRAVTQKLSAKTVTALVRRPTQAQLEWLDAHLGRPMTVRDPNGGKFVGIYFETGYTRPASDGTGRAADMSLTLAEVTSDEAV